MSETAPHIIFFNKRPDPVWRVTLVNGTYWNHPGDQAPPNAFHRFMQRLAFGVKWERIPAPKIPERATE